VLLKSNITRQKGTIIEFDGPEGPRSVLYHFRPDADGDHVADVSDDHAEILLALPGKAFSFKRTAVAVAATEPSAGPAKPAEKKAEQVTQSVPPTLSILTVKPTDGALSEATDAAGGNEREALIAEYLALFGQNPHPAIKTETLRAKIAEKKAETASN
jgi:hypothetical protein